MYLENARALIQGSFVLIFLGIAYFVHMQIGLVLTTIQGLLIVQSSFTNWCIPDPLLKRMGFEKRCE